MGYNGGFMGKNIIGQAIIIWIILGAILLLSLFIIVLIRMVKLTKKLSVANHENEKMNMDYNKLESIYQSTLSSSDALTSRYEELNKNNESIRKLAYTDYLTELPNRTAFNEMLDSIMLTLRNDEIIALMIIDLDDLKNVNNTLGHSYGDELLIDVTHRIKQVLDENDYLARIGGDEFVVLTQNLNDMASYEEKIRKVNNVFTYPFILSTKEYFVSVNIGIAFAPKDGKTSQSLVKNANSAMYMSKISGKNSYIYYEEDFNQILTNKIEIQSELRRAIEKNEFMLLYQAIMDINNKKPIGFEALIRWNHPQKGLLSPSEFLDLAEEAGLMVPIGKWVLLTACQQLKEWSDLGNDINMAINLSARQFKDNDFIETVYEVIKETDINPKKLELEITEAVALEDIDYTINTIKELQKLDLSFSLDDFGTGYSSINSLKLLPLKNIKIDNSLIDNILDDSNQKIIQAIISLAKDLNLNVIAEGVESLDQENFLIKSKCNMAQGYLYSQPLEKTRQKSF